MISYRTTGEILYTIALSLSCLLVIRCVMLKIHLIWKMILKEQMMLQKRIVLIYTRVRPK